MGNLVKFDITRIYMISNGSLGWSPPRHMAKSEGWLHIRNPGSYRCMKINDTLNTRQELIFHVVNFSYYRIPCSHDIV